MIEITFPDNSVKQFEDGVTPLEIARSLSPQLARDVLAASVDGQDWDLTRPIHANASLKLFKWEDPEGKVISRPISNSDFSSLAVGGVPIF